MNNAIAVANSVLLAQRTLKLIQNVPKMKFDDKEIIIDTIQNYASITGLPANILLHDRRSPLRDGLKIHRQGTSQYIVLYNEDIVMPERLRFTLAHEIGHIFLGHTCDGDAEESEANAFAAQLLMPWFTVKMLHCNYFADADNLSAMFGVSITAADRRLREVRNTNYVLTDADKRIWDKQRRYAHDKSGNICKSQYGRTSAKRGQHSCTVGCASEVCQ